VKHSEPSDTPDTNDAHDAHDTTMSPFAKKLSLWLVGISVVLGLLDFVIHRHGYSKIEEMPLFFAVFGFLAFLAVVAGGVILRVFISRSKDYYDE
jgi:hypothetical protein